MAYTIQTTADSALELQEYMQYVESNVDLSDEQSIAESGTALRKLANNRQFIAEHLNRELSSWKNFQARNRYTSQVLLPGNLGSFVATPGTGRVMLCRLARHFGNGESLSLLHDLALQHGSRRVRAEALSSLASLDPSQREEIAGLGLRDKDPFVKSAALELLRNAGTATAC